MANGKRIIFLGATGIEKRSIADKLSDWCGSNLGHSFKIIDFEKDYLENRAKWGNPLWHFLAQQVAKQNENWRKAWDHFAKDWALGTKDKADEFGDNLILLLHGAIVRSNYGVRCVCDLHRVSTFRPDIIVTLIDDVYNLWWRTEARAHGEFHRGRPTLEQLIMARRTEQLLGDMIAFQGQEPARHLVLSVNHPIRTLGSYIFTARRVVYLSFPITRPLEMLEGENDHRGIDGVNNFLTFIYKHQESSSNLTFINPLSIDELPLLNCLNNENTKCKAQNGNKEVEGVKFDIEKRWSLEDFWNRESFLSCGSPPKNKQVPLVRKQVEDAEALIRSDVGWRDFRLVMQADALAVFNPVMARDKLSRGVEAEMLAAITESKPVYVYQDAKLDPNGKFLEWLGKPGTMSTDTRQQWIVPMDSLEDMMKRLEH